jgi:hypothetical protein
MLGQRDPIQRLLKFCVGFSRDLCIATDGFATLWPFYVTGVAVLRISAFLVRVFAAAIP